MADYRLDEKETACLNRALARMREKGVPRAKALFEVLEYLERELDSAEQLLAEKQERLTGYQAELSNLNNHPQTDLSSALDTIKRCGWKPTSINFSESGVEIFLE